MMAIESSSELILNHDETIDFINDMRHPDIEALRKGRDFLASLDNIEVEYHDGESIAWCPNISLPESDGILYEGEKSSFIEWKSIFRIEQKKTTNMMCDLFDREEKINYRKKYALQEEQINMVKNVPNNPKAA